MRIAAENVPVLVTGGAGFIGSHIVDLLVRAGSRVTVLDNFRNGKLENLATAKATGRLRVIHGDVTDFTTCERAIRGAQAVLHLACLGVRHSLHNPIENHQVNALGTLNLLVAAKRSPVERFLYVSTSEVYGGALAFPLREESTTWPNTVYGASKLAGEHYAAAAHLVDKIPVIRVRPFNNYGPRAHFEGDAGEVIPRFVLGALAGIPPVIFGDGSNTRDFLYVEDSADALVRIAECDAMVGEIVNLGYGEEIRIDHLATQILAVLNRPELGVRFEMERPGDVPRLWVDATKVRNITGWTPRISLRVGLEKTVEYFKQLHAADEQLGRSFETRNWVP